MGRGAYEREAQTEGGLALPAFFEQFIGRSVWCVDFSLNIAVHALFSEQKPLDSFLLLSESGRHGPFIRQHQLFFFFFLSMDWNILIISNNCFKSLKIPRHCIVHFQRVACWQMCKELFSVLLLELWLDPAPDVPLPQSAWWPGTCTEMEEWLPSRLLHYQSVAIIWDTRTSRAPAWVYFRKALGRAEKWTCLKPV